jgi:hypothetical protein
MYSILDIDLDYFNHIPDAPHHFGQMLTWATCPVSMVLERLKQALGSLKEMKIGNKFGNYSAYFMFILFFASENRAPCR